MYVPRVKTRSYTITASRLTFTFVVELLLCNDYILDICKGKNSTFFGFHHYIFGSDSFNTRFLHLFGSRISYVKL